jgi:thiamine pyrophosphokinase
MDDRRERASGAGPTVVVFTGGDPPGPVALDDLPAHAFVIAADSGLHHARRAGWPIDLIVGDLDSIDLELLATAESEGVPVERHPVAKDETDLELALHRALALRAQRVVVVGGGGGRLDHLLANTAVLSSDAFSSLRLEARHGGSTVHVVRDRLDIRGEAGELVSLIATHGDACGVTTDGLLYPLRGETLAAGSTRGVSNEMVASRAVVALERGVLLVVVPGGRGTHFDLIDNGGKP